MTSIEEARERLTEQVNLAGRRFAERQEIADRIGRLELNAAIPQRVHDIAALLDALSQAEGVIEPFAERAERFEDLMGNPAANWPDERSAPNFAFSVGDFRRAATFLASLKEKK